MAGAAKARANGHRRNLPCHHSKGRVLDVVGGLFGEHPGDGPCHFERVPQAPHEADPAEALHAGSRESLGVGPFCSDEGGEAGAEGVACRATEGPSGWRRFEGRAEEKPPPVARCPTGRPGLPLRRAQGFLVVLVAPVKPRVHCGALAAADAHRRERERGQGRGQAQGARVVEKRGELLCFEGLGGVHHLEPLGPGSRPK
mmetsp:Transcript_15721/g.36538  ORF Transcript_15721/g.36538 Transcript_15721/m.36538 type:complete len:200 (+) Transcript_15721:371-970(+)